MKPALILQTHALAFAGACVCAGANAAPADLVRGEQLYARCAACHALNYDRVGPRHCGLIGRRAGSVPGFDYSFAMRDSGIVWDRQTLDHFLTKPLAMVPGSKMTYDGVPDASDRRDLIAYIAAANDSPVCKSGR